MWAHDSLGSNTYWHVKFRDLFYAGEKKKNEKCDDVFYIIKEKFYTDK